MPDDSDEVSTGLLEAARVAPSAVNLQPWLIQKADNRYNFYLRPPRGIIERLIRKMRYIDIGIAMAHMAVQAKADGLKVSFDFEGNDTEQGKFIAGIIVY